jgi:uncharacterized protein (DUF1684 family)
MTITHDVLDQHPDQQTTWNQWHAARERDLAVPHGWLSLTAFQWLTDTATSVVDLPGRFGADDRGAFVTATAGDGLLLASGPSAGEPVDGTVTAEVAEAGSLLWLRYRDVLVELVLRGGRYAVRLRDPQAPERTAFRRIPAFPFDDAWRVTGHFTSDGPHPLTVDTARPDLRQLVTAVGAVSFAIGGTRYTLIATAGRHDRLNLLFHDLTNGDQTAPWRVVSTSVPQDDGTVVIDFNRAVNLPFAFTQFGTCPAPVAGNQVPIAVTAGELAPVRVTGPAARGETAVAGP